MRVTKVQKAIFPVGDHLGNITWVEKRLARVLEGPQSAILHSYLWSGGICENCPIEILQTPLVADFY